MIYSGSGCARRYPNADEVTGMAIPAPVLHREAFRMDQRGMASVLWLVAFVATATTLIKTHPSLLCAASVYLLQCCFASSLAESHAIAAIRTAQSGAIWMLFSRAHIPTADCTTSDEHHQARHQSALSRRYDGE